MTTRWIAFLIFTLAGRVCFALEGMPHCDRNSECPPWLAQIVTDIPSVCSSFLIKPDILLTNRHCLKESLRQPGAGCQGVKVRFPSTPEFPAEEVACQTVIETSDSLPSPMKWILDMAVIKLARPVQRKTIEVNPETPRAGESLEIYKVDPAPLGKSTPVIRKTSCVSGPPGMNIFFTAEPSPELTLQGCTIEKGNSGSPILNSKGQVIAILWGKSEFQQPTGASPNTDLPATKIRWAHGSPLRCFSKEALPRLQLNGSCISELPSAAKTQLEAEYKQGRSENPEAAESRRRAVLQLDKSFEIMMSKFKDLFLKPDGQEQKAIFNWTIKEIRVLRDDQKVFWGRHAMVPLCVNGQYLQQFLERNQMDARKMKLQIPLPMAHLVRVYGEPEHYFTSMMEVKTMTISSDFSNFQSQKKMSLSYQVEVTPKQTELALAEISECAKE